MKLKIYYTVQVEVPGFEHHRQEPVFEFFEFKGEKIPPGYGGDCSFETEEKKIRDFFFDWQRAGVKQINNQFIPFHCITGIVKLTT